MSLAKKTRYSYPGIAWVPTIGPMLIVAKAAKMHWWPILLLIGLFIPFIGWIALITLFVFYIIWLWYTFESVGRPGWWAVLQLIPIVGLILIGVAAWGEPEEQIRVKKKVL